MLRRIEKSSAVGRVSRRFAVPLLAVGLVSAAAGTAVSAPVRSYSAPTPGEDSTLNAVSATGSHTWAAGWFIPSAGRTSHPLLLERAGSSWSRVSISDPGPDAQLASVDSTWAVGSWTDGTLGRGFALHFSNGSWKTSTIPQPADASVSLAGVDSDFIVGSATVTGQGGTAFSLRWGGSGWRRVATPSPGVSAGLSAVNGDWAVGNYTASGGATTGAFVLQWTDGAWRRATLDVGGVSDPSLYSISGAWAVGQYKADDTVKLLIVHRTGDVWKRVTSPSSPNGSGLYGVAGPVAVGSSGGDPTSQALIFRDESGHWTSNAAPAVGAASQLWAVSGDWAVGEFAKTVTGLPKALILHWTGSRWVRS